MLRGSCASADCLLARLPPQWRTSQNRAALTDATQIPWLRKSLLHLPCLNFAIMYLLRERCLWPCLTSRLLLDLSNSNDRAHFAFVDEMLSYEAHMRCGLLVPSPLINLSTVGRRLKEMEKLPAKPHLILPLPPLASPQGIEPLATSLDLLQEGREQENCIGTIAVQRRVIAGDIYCYRVTQPIRATILLRKVADGRWSVDQIKAARNKAVPAEAVWFIAPWLRCLAPVYAV